MSTPLENGIQEDLRTYPMYQRLRKINPYAYYSLNIQKQMQSDLRNHGSLVFFEQTPETMPELDDPNHGDYVSKKDFIRIYEPVAVTKLNSRRQFSQTQMLEAVKSEW